MIISGGGDDPEKIEALVQENRQLKMRVEQLDEKVKAGFVQNLESNPSPVKPDAAPPKVITKDSPEKDQIIQELSQQISLLKIREQDLLKQIADLESQSPASSGNPEDL